MPYDKSLQNLKARVKEFAKRHLQAMLRRAHRRLIYVPEGKVSGIDFHADLQRVINRPNPICLDVGANEGQTIEMFQTVFDRPTIYAFEPSRKTFEVLQAKNFGAQTFLNNFALGKEATFKEFLHYEVSLLNSFLPIAPDEKNRLQNIKLEGRDWVEIKTLDDFLEEHTLETIDLLKIDTQGFEMAVLLGAKKSFQAHKIRNVLVELCFVPMYEDQSLPEDVDKFLLKHGFHLVDYYEKFRQDHVLAWCTALYSKKEIDLDFRQIRHSYRLE